MLQHIHESPPALCRTSVRQEETVGGGGWCSPPPVIVITTVKFKSLVKLWLNFFFLLPMMQRCHGLAYMWHSMPPLLPL